MFRWIITITTMIVLSGCAASGDGPQGDKSSEVDMDEFVEGFYSDEHALECGRALDRLRTMALEKIFTADNISIDSDLSDITTPGGIFMVYSVILDDSKYYHTFSVSRSPYLARVFGTSIVGMACERFALPDPEYIGLSSRQVFHADWVLTSEEQKAVLEADLPELAGAVNQLMGNGMIRGMSIEIKPLDIDYETLTE